MEGAKGEEGRPWLSLFLVQFDVSNVMWFIFAQLWDLSLVKVELPML